MEDASMTAKVSAFSRAYHARHNDVKVFDDPLAYGLLGEEEYCFVAQNMAKGIAFFNPEFRGTSDEALRWVVDNQLAPSVVERAAFAEQALQQACAEGVKRYLIFGSGFDTFAYRRPDWARNLDVFELDKKAMVEDKQRRLTKAHIDIPRHTHLVAVDLADEEWPHTLADQTDFLRGEVNFCSLLGLVYYLSKNDFAQLLDGLSSFVAPGSWLVFDYPTVLQGATGLKQEALAQGAGEQMRARYAQDEMTALLHDKGMWNVETLTPETITERFFSAYNEANPLHPMGAFPGVNICCARI